MQKKNFPQLKPHEKTFSKKPLKKTKPWMIVHTTTNWNGWQFTNKTQLLNILNDTWLPALTIAAISNV